MIKIIPPNAWGMDFDAPQLELVKTSSYGLKGEDLRAFIKRASHPLSDWVRNNPPGKGGTYLHCIALGCTEKYSFNRNADSYPERMLERDHTTFEKYARFYLNHKNTDPKKSYGIIKKAMWMPELGRVDVIVELNTNKEAADRNGGLVATRTLNKMASGQDVAVSQSCFPPGERVLMANSSFKPIEQIEHGDYVVSHLGNIKEVGHKIKLDYNGKVIKIRANGTVGILTATADHKIWVRPKFNKKGDCPVCSKTCNSLNIHFDKKIKNGHTDHIPYMTSYSTMMEGWKRADEIKVGDYVRTPFDNTVGEDKGEPIYAMLLGYYAAEGSIYSEKKYRGKVQGYIPEKDYMQGVAFSFGITEDRYADRVRDNLRAYGAKGVIGRQVDHKKNTLTVRARGKDLRLLFEKDGGRYSDRKCFSDEVMHWSPENQLILVSAYFEGDGTWNKTLKRLAASTASERMAYQIATMLWRNGIPAGLHRAYGPAKIKRNCKPGYNITIQGRYVHRLYVDKVPEDFEFKLEKPLKAYNINTKQYQGYNYSISTTKPRSYIEGNYIYCRVNTVTQEDYNGPVYNFGVKEDESYVVRGIGVKNCRVPEDECASCGHKAKSRSEYCGPENCKYGGCSTNLGRAFDDGFYLGVHNNKCSFYDLSDVSDSRGADKIAFISGKVANNDVFKGGNELAESLGLISPDYLLDPNSLTAISCLRKLASFNYPSHIPTAPSWDDCVTVRTALVKHAHALPSPKDITNPHQFVADLASIGVILPPAQWLSYMTQVEASKCASAFVGGIDPTSHLLVRNDLHDLITETPVSDDKHLIFKYSYLIPSATAHARETSLGVLANKEASVKQANTHPFALDIKGHYLAYQARALAQHDNTPIFNLLLSECARHNKSF